MNADQPYEGILRYVRARWPAYAAALGAVALAFILVSLGADRSQWWLTLLGIALLLILTYFFTTTLWAAHEQFDRRRSLPSHTIFELGQVQPTDHLVYVGLGIRDTPVQLSRRLTRGRVQAIDVYNPQLTPGGALARRRRLAPPAPHDPRLVWLEGSVDLLPLPDNSVPLIATSYTFVEFWQHGDRSRLLREMRRVLQPDGVLLFAEPARTRTQIFTIGPAAWRLPPVGYWRKLLTDAGFNITREKSIGDYYLCFRAEKPFPGAVQQLALDLGV